MNLEEAKTKYYFFKPQDYGRVFIFIDFGNVRPWANELWPEENKYKFCTEIDIRKLSDVCNWIKPAKKFFYYGFYPPTHKQHAGSVFRIDLARKSCFAVKTKEIKMIPNYDENGNYLGKRPKCNFDVEITMDILTKIQKYDTVMIFSGDSDFSGLLGYIKEKGKKVIVVCTRNRLSAELKAVADVFVPAETLRSFLQYKNTPAKPGV